MLEERILYLDKILDELKSLEAIINSSKVDNALPFSFFNDAFLKTQNVVRFLRELELHQVEEMKVEIEKLAKYIAKLESEQKREVVSSDVLIKEDLTVDSSTSESVMGRGVIIDSSASESVMGQDVEELGGVIVPPHIENEHAKDLVLPIYKKSDVGVSGEKVVHQSEKRNVLMDEIKRNLSINDRFLFQRELFHNNRLEMDDVFRRLHEMESFEDALGYLKENMGWDFEAPVVKDFVDVVRTGFK